MAARLNLAYAAAAQTLGQSRTRTAIVAGLLIALSLGTLLWGRACWAKISLLYWQSRCLRYEAPPSQVISSLDGRSKHPPVEWARFYALATAGVLQSDGTAFLHRRESGRGARLVAVDVYQRGFSRTLVARAFRPGTLFSRPVEVTANSSPMAGVPLGAIVYRGERNPADASHFTIRYEAAGRTHIIDGWLTDDDRVLLEERRRSLARVTASP